jgi:hypothetical protein
VDDRATQAGLGLPFGLVEERLPFQLLTFSIDIRAIILFPVKIQNYRWKNGPSRSHPERTSANRGTLPLYKSKKEILSAINHR